MKKFKMACGLALTMAGLLGVNAAHAAPSFSDQVTATKDIVFNETAQALTFDIAIPDGTLTAGALADAHVVATSKVSNSTGKLVGTRFTQGLPNQVISGTYKNIAEIKGQNDNTNILKLGLNGSSSQPSEWKTVNGDMYLVEKTVGDDNTRLQAVGAQTVKADTYVLSLDAAVYNP